jgi:hypothetical protein
MIRHEHVSVNCAAIFRRMILKPSEIALTIQIVGETG